jgi:hypothetical protein
VAYFPDFGKETAVVSGPLIRAVGWLSSTQSFNQGPVPAEFSDRLELICERWDDGVEALEWPVAAGPHTCELCGDFHAAGFVGVPGDGILFVAPEMVAHYVDDHGYLPPADFVEAVLACPIPGTEEYELAVAPFIES